MQVSLHYYNGIVINVSDTRQNYSILFQNCSGSTDVLDMLLRSNIFIWTPVQKTIKQFPSPPYMLGLTLRRVAIF